MTKDIDLPRNIIFVLHGKTELNFVNDLLYEFVSYLFEYYGLGYFKFNEENPIPHIAKSYDNNIYHSFSNLEKSAPVSIGKVIKELKEEDGCNLKHSFCVVYILDEDVEDSRLLIEKYKSEKMYLEIAKKALESNEAKFHSSFLYSVRHSFEDTFKDYHTVNIGESKNKQTKAMRYCRHKKDILSKSENPDEYIKNLQINNDKSNIEELFVMFKEWIEQIIKEIEE